MKLPWVGASSCLLAIGLIACGAGTEAAFCGGSSHGSSVSITINTGSCPTQATAVPAPAAGSGTDDNR